MKAFEIEHFILSVGLKMSAIESFSEYPFSLSAVKGLRSPLEMHPSVTFVVGENGSGKSTLLEALAISQGFNPEGGTKNFNFATRRSHSVLNDYLRVSKSMKMPKTGYFFAGGKFFQCRY